MKRSSWREQELKCSGLQVKEIYQAFDVTHARLLLQVCTVEEVKGSASPPSSGAAKQTTSSLPLREGHAICSSQFTMYFESPGLSRESTQYRCSRGTQS